MKISNTHHRTRRGIIKRNPSKRPKYIEYLYKDREVKIYMDNDGDWNIYIDGKMYKDAFATLEQAKNEIEEYIDNQGELYSVCKMCKKKFDADYGGEICPSCDDLRWEAQDDLKMGDRLNQEMLRDMKIERARRRG